MDQEQPKDEKLVHVGWLLQRLRLERQLLIAAAKLGLFLIYFVCFTNALSTFQPADEIGRAQRHLETRLGLGAASSVGDFSELYPFIEAFEAKTAVLQQESAKYWCERTYFHRVWNQTFDVPMATCSHVELDSVVAAGGHSKTYDRIGKFPGPQMALAPAVVWQTRWKTKACEGFAEKYNSLASSPLVASTSVYSLHGGKLNGTTLAAGTMTFDEAKAKCIGMAGCAGFTFAGARTSSPVPVIFKGASNATGTGWSSVTPEFVVKSARGERPAGEDTLPCVDRSESSDSRYAFQIPCHSGNCDRLHRDHGSTTDFSQRRTFRDVDVYPQILYRTGKDGTMLRQLGWMDSLTESVTVAAIAYTEQVEIFTLVTVRFEANSAGGLESEVRMFSYKDNDAVNKGHFLGCMITAFLFGLAALSWCAFTLATQPATRTCKVHLFEFVMELFLVLFALVVMIIWGNQDSNNHECYKLLTSFLSMTGFTAEQQDKVAEQFLNAADKILDRTTFCFNTRIASYVLLHLMFIQVVLYFRAHPKMRRLVDTVVRGLADIVHFVLLLIPLFLILGAMAQYAFGPHIDDFKTYSATLSLQVRRLFGEVLVDAGVQNRLPIQQLVLYWIYTLTMWLVIFWTFVYLLVAIVIDAFAAPKDLDQAVGNSFWWDFVDCLSAPVIWQQRGWPAQDNLVKSLAAVPAPNGLLAYRDFVKLGPIVKAKGQPFALLMKYDSKCGCGSRLLINAEDAPPMPALEAPPLLAMPPAPKAEAPAAQPEIVLHRKESALELSAVDVPFLQTATQKAIVTQVQQLMEKRLRECVKLGTQCDWESMSSELAEAAVKQAQQVLITRFTAPDTKVESIGREASPQKGPALAVVSPGGLRTPVKQENASAAGGAGGGVSAKPMLATPSPTPQPPGQVDYLEGDSASDEEV